MTTKPTRPRFFVLEPDTIKVLKEIRSKPQFKLRSLTGLAEDTKLTKEKVLAAIQEAGQHSLVVSQDGKSGTMFGLSAAGKIAIY